MTEKNAKPNILVIICDDLGYGDLSCMGAQDFVTPNIDRLAACGVRFDSFYSASPVCSPSRASLLTGRYPGNAGVRAILSGHRKASGLQSYIPTLPSVLKAQGYYTAMSGKWHLGLKDECRPRSHGFDHFFGFLSGCLDYYSHTFYYGMVDGKMNPSHDLWRDEQEIYRNGEYLTQEITRESIGYIREARKADKPFFLYTAYNAPHYPMHAPAEYMERFAHLPADRQLMAAMISAMDDGVGEIVNELVRTGEFENTLVYFQSDNGPSRESRNWTDGRMDPYYGGSAGGLRGYKFSLFEGGIRIPAIVSFPAKLPSGVVCHEPCCAIDILPSICALLDIPAPEKCDGMDILSAVGDCKPIPQRTLFWEMDNQTAARRGDWKLILNPVEDGGSPVQYDLFLGNLSSDLSETQNLAHQYPQLAKELEAEARTWRDGIEDVWKREFAGNYTTT